jgi:hypothetical protein
LHLKDLNQKLDSFLPPSTFELYSHHCQTVAQFFPFPAHLTGLVLIL